MGARGYFAACLLICAAVSATALALWSSMALGRDCLGALQRLQVWSSATGGVVLVVFLLLYCLDFFWPPHLPGRYCCLWEGDRCVGPALASGAALAALAGCFLMAGNFPWVPLVATIFACPALIFSLWFAVRRPEAAGRARHAGDLGREAGGCGDRPSGGSGDSDDFSARLLGFKEVVKQDAHQLQFFRAAKYALTVVGCVDLAIWIGWLVMDTEPYGRIEYADSLEKQTHIILWCAPLVVAASFLALALIMGLRVFLGEIYAQTDATRNVLTDAMRKESHTKARLRHQKTLLECKVLGPRVSAIFSGLDDAQKEECLSEHVRYMDQLQVVLKCLCVVITSILALNFAAYQLATDNEHLLLMICAILAMLILTLVALVYVGFSRLWMTMGTWLADMPVFKAARARVDSDWFRAWCVFWALPLAPALLGLSAANQCARRCRGAHDLEGLPRGGVLTARVGALGEAARGWDWISIITDTYIIGVCVVGYVMSPIMLKPFLAWMISLLGDLSFGSIVVAVWLSGMVLFLLPPVPGAPVYLFGGVLLSGKGEATWGDPSGFWIGSFACVFVCWVLKLCACALQQKCIGEQLGHALWVRQTVGVHKPFIRAIESILRKPGLSMGKVAILCGGPDWPTSVLAGVLRLSLLQCELGTAPILLYIAPLSLTGSFFYKRDAGEMWTNAGDLMFSITAVMTILFWAVIGWVIQRTLQEEHDDLMQPKEQYIELDWLDYRAQAISERCRCVVSWADVPCCVRAVVVPGCLAMVAAGHLFYWASPECFTPFQITDDIESLTWYGEGDSVILKPGWAGLAVAGASCGGLCALRCWRAAATRDARAEVARALDGEEEGWKRERLELARRPCTGEEGGAERISGAHTSVAAPAACARADQPAPLPSADVPEAVAPTTLGLPSAEGEAAGGGDPAAAAPQPQKKMRKTKKCATQDCLFVDEIEVGADGKSAGKKRLERQRTRTDGQRPLETE